MSNMIDWTEEACGIAHRRNSKLADGSLTAIGWWVYPSGERGLAVKDGDNNLYYRSIFGSFHPIDKEDFKGTLTNEPGAGYATTLTRQLFALRDRAAGRLTQVKDDDGEAVVSWWIKHDTNRLKLLKIEVPGLRHLALYPGDGESAKEYFGKVIEALTDSAPLDRLPEAGTWNMSWSTGCSRGYHGHCPTCGAFSCGKTLFIKQEFIPSPVKKCRYCESL